MLVGDFWKCTDFKYACKWFLAMIGSHLNLWFKSSSKFSGIFPLKVPIFNQILCNAVTKCEYIILVYD